MNVVLLGYPGSGKGTQSRKICYFYDLLPISPGELARNEVKRQSRLGTTINRFLENGHLLPTEIMLSLVSSYLKETKDSKKGYLLDGFPRNLEQVKFIESLLNERGHFLATVLNLSVNFNVLLQRLCGRFSCKGCGMIYNRYFLIPTIEGVCNYCHGVSFTRREDDNERVARSRLDVYDYQTKPVLHYFTLQGLLRTVDGMQKPNKVLEQIDGYLSQLFKKVRA